MSGRKAATDVRPGHIALSVGNPNTPLPKDWRWVDLSEVATMATGHTPSRNHAEYWGGEIPWISVKDARPYHGKSIFETAENTNPLGISKSAAVILPKGTVCLSRTGSIGYAILLGKEMSTSQGFVNWICSDALLPRYLQLLFMAENTFLHNISEGVAHTTIYFPAAKAFHVALPPVEEQHRIVGKIEELFSDLDKGIETLKTAQQQLKVYRQAVLKWAFEGKLSNHNLESGTTPLGWRQDTFGSLTHCHDGKRIPLSKTVRAKRKGPYRYYGATEVVDYIDQYLFHGEYLLIGEDGANLLSKSKPLAFIAEGKFWVNNHAHIVQAKSGISLRYLCYFINSLHLDRWVTGTAQPKLTQANLNKIPISIPISEDEQELIVSELEARFSHCERLEQSLVKSISQAEGLRQSILKKAFEGKLVSQDSNDEPAHVLLERIRSEKKLASPKAVPAKTKNAKPKNSRAKKAPATL
jgi:type I restriction enzyme S subunit